MDGIPARKLASTIGLPVERLLGHLNDMGIRIESETDLVTGVQQLRLLQRLPALESESPANRLFAISEVQAATNLRDLNRLLTEAMSARTIQALIKDKNLNLVIEAVLAHVGDPKQQLLAAAVLGRLAAVARGRESEVFSRADDVLTTEPTSIETLEDADEKTYAAMLLSHSTRSWVSSYSYREAVTIDTADAARRELLAANLSREGSISGWIQGVTEHADVLRVVKGEDARLRRVRRIFAAMRAVASTWRGDVGKDVGDRLAECMRVFLSRAPTDTHQEVLYESMDNLLAVLCRVIELRFSSALYSSTYTAASCAMVVNSSSLLPCGVAQPAEPTIRSQPAFSSSTRLSSSAAAKTTILGLAITVPFQAYSAMWLNNWMIFCLSLSGSSGFSIETMFCSRCSILTVPVSKVAMAE